MDRSVSHLRLIPPSGRPDAAAEPRANPEIRREVSFRVDQPCYCRVVEYRPGADPPAPRPGLIAIPCADGSLVVVTLTHSPPR